MSINLTSAMTSNYILYNLNKSTDNYGKSMDRLTSGSKITQVSDDPIGVSKVAKLNVQISANSVQKANIAQGQDLLSLAEGNQDLVVSNLQRIRDLTMQAASGTYDSLDKDAMLQEINARLTQINTIANTTQFNSKNLLDGSASNMTLQIGASSAASLNVGSALIDVHTAALGVDIGAVTGATWTQTDAQAYLSTIDTALNTMTVADSKLGGFMNRLDDASANLTSIADSMTSNRSIISDCDVATESADIVKYQIMQQASASILTQANQVPSWALNLLK